MNTTAALALDDSPTLSPPAPDLAQVRRSYTRALEPRVEEELVERHLALVKTIVGRLAMTLPSHVDTEDLYSSGLVGLLDAVRHFDPQGGSSFESYARVRIRGAILDELRRLDWVPRSIHGKARKVQAMQQSLEQTKGGVPTDSEMAQALHLSPVEYDRLLTEIRPASFVCLDRTDPDGDTEGYDLIADPTQEAPVDAVTRRERGRMVAERLQQLPDMQKKVLALYYDQDLRLKEIAQVFGLTESRICQIHAQAILAIKGYIQTQESKGLVASPVSASPRRP